MAALFFVFTNKRFRTPVLSTTRSVGVRPCYREENLTGLISGQFYNPMQEHLKVKGPSTGLNPPVLYFHSRSKFTL